MGAMPAGMASGDDAKVLVRYCSQGGPKRGEAPGFHFGEPCASGCPWGPDWDPDWGELGSKL